MSETYIDKRIREVMKSSDKKESFVARNYLIFIVASFLIYPLASLYSAVTEAGNLYSIFSEQFQNTTLALALTIGLVLFVEGGVFLFGKGAMDDLTNGVFGEGGAFLSMFFVKMAAFLLFFAYSTTNSIQGSQNTTAYISKQIAPPTLLDVDSVRAHHQAAVALADQDAQQYFERRQWKGRLGGDDQQEYSRLLQVKSARQDTVYSRVEAAEAENAARVASWEDQLGKTQSWTYAFAWLGQAGQLLYFLLYVIYKPGEHNEVRNALERATGRDIDGNGHIGAPPRSSTDPELDEKAIAAAVAKLKEEDERVTVRPFQHRERPPEIQHKPPVEIQAKNNEFQTIQTESTKVLSNEITRLRNYWRRANDEKKEEAYRLKKMDEYRALKADLEQYVQIVEVSPTSLKIHS